MEYFLTTFLIVASTTLASAKPHFKDILNEEEVTFELPIYSTSISRATVRVILDFYAKESSTLAITRATGESDGHDQQSFVSEVLYHTKANISFTNEDYWAAGNDRLRFFNAMFIDGYQAFR